MPEPFSISIFRLSNLSRIGLAPGWTLWAYKCADLAEALRPNHLWEAHDMLSLYDHIHIVAPNGGTLVRVVSNTKELVSVEKLS